MQKWIEWLITQACSWDLENLKLSAYIIGDSLGPNLLSQVISLADLYVPGPILFIIAIQQINYITDFLVRIVCNQISKFKLKNLPGKNMVIMRESITKKIKNTLTYP